ncbi:MAG: hypothetical protein M1825_004589 [Sarcosagium campestre]|nr:MAG: hypothetical protein M1825_004589 [Sarcosagium campestre]
MESDMNGVGSSMSPPVNVPAAAGKRKRSEDSALDLSKSRHAPTKKPVEKVHINYLRRVLQDDIEIVSEEDSLDIMKSLITAYEDILRRNESFAANCGAKPLSQTLVTRFLRMFDSNVKILQPSPKPGVTVSWLDVVEYAKVHDDFALNQVYHGDRVCQLSIKGCKIEISEDDFLLIKSGQPQRLFPPQPIAEDEEKELATVGILTDRLRAIIQECDTGKQA